MLNKRTIVIEGFSIFLTRKKMKYIRLRVDTKGIHVSAPMRAPLYEIERFIVDNQSWITERKLHFDGLLTKQQNELCDGAKILLWGEKLTLVHKPLKHKKRSFVQLSCHGLGAHEIKEQGLPERQIIFHLDSVKSQCHDEKQKLLDDFYRRALKKAVPELLEKWQPVVGRSANEWGVKKMKTRWGSCNIDRARIWLNLELARWPLECLEYVLVHELTHLLETNHTKRFWALIEKAMPNWKDYHSMLKTVD